MDRNFVQNLVLWIQAARPKTLPASVSPVLVAGALAYKEGFFQPLFFALAFIVALFAQIASNFANDYFDFKKGIDGEERLGPERAVAKGWVTPKSMLVATMLTLGLACMAGLLLVFLTDMRLLFVGVVIAIGVLAYSAGPFPLASNGLGDVCVLLFYGIVPVCFTYYVQTAMFSTLAFILSLAIGMLSVNILIVNNYRDYEQDALHKKRTTIVLFGRKFGVVVYLVNILLAFLLLLPLLLTAPLWILPLAALIFTLSIATWQQMIHKTGRELNVVLGRTARNVLLFSLLVITIILAMEVGEF